MDVERAREMPYGGDSKDDVEHPSHYASDGIECIDAMYAISPVIAIHFTVGSALKYLDRAGLKGDELKDLKKARECWHMAKRMIRKVVEDGKD